MFEVVPSLARDCPGRGRRAFRPGSLSERVGLSAGALAVVVLVGCGTGVDRETPRTSVNGAGSGAAVNGERPGVPGERPVERPPDGEMAPPCVVGTWATAPRACECPAAGQAEYTAECGVSDCQQADVLVLRAGGEAVRGSVRFSAKAGSLSAVGGKVEKGEWKFFDDGELKLRFGVNEKYTPTGCAERALVPKGEAPLSSPSEALLAAITWALSNDDWTGAPYHP